MLIHDDNTSNPGRVVILGKSDALTLGRSPSSLECWWYGRLVVQMLTRPGRRSLQVLEALVRGVLARFPRPKHLALSDLRRDTLDSFTARVRSCREFSPETETLEGVLDAAFSYMRKAIQNRATSVLRKLGPISIPLEDAPDEFLAGEDSELPEDVDKSSDDDSTIDAGAATSLGRWSGPVDLNTFARMHGRARNTIRNAIYRAAIEFGFEIPVVATEWRILPIHEAAILACLRGRRAACPRKKRQRFPKNAIVFGGDLSGPDQADPIVPPL